MQRTLVIAGALVLAAVAAWWALGVAGPAPVDPVPVVSAAPTAPAPAVADAAPARSEPGLLPRPAAVAAPSTPPLPVVEGADQAGWTGDELTAAAHEAVTHRLAEERRWLATGVAAVPAERRDAVAALAETALARMDAIGVEVDRGADPVEAYTRIHGVKRALVDDVRAALGDDADPVVTALGPPGADDAGWGIPVEELGWGEDADR